MAIQATTLECILELYLGMHFRVVDWTMKKEKQESLMNNVNLFRAMLNIVAAHIIFERGPNVRQSIFIDIVEQALLILWSKRY